MNDIFEDNDGETESSSSQDTKEEEDNVPLMDLLTSHAEGRRLLTLLKNQGTLTNCGRGKLCNLIVGNFLGDDPCNAKVTSAQLLEVARQIKRIFPKENVSTYFVQFKWNGKSKSRQNASGKLHSCLRNRKREYREAKKKAGEEDKDVSEGTSTSMAETDELLENAVRLHNARESWGTMEKNIQKNSIMDILMANPDGRTLLKLNKNKGVLDSNGRRKLCHLIVKDILGDDPNKVRISSKNLLNLARQIKDIFPKENVSTYFIPYTKNKQFNVISPAKGKLYACLVNRKKRYNKELKKVEEKPKKSYQSSSTSTFPTGAKRAYVSKDILWLNNFSGPWELVEKKWKKTLEYRLSQLKESLGVAQYMTQYPALKIPTGYRLLIQDFETLYLGYKDKLCESFPLYKATIIEIAFERLKRTQDSTIKSLLEDYEIQSQHDISEDNDDDTGSIGSQDMNEEEEYIAGDEETELILPALDINKRQDDRTRSGGITSHDQPLMDLLTSHAEGRRLLRLFRDQGVLSNNGRGKLCNLIIRTFLGDDPYNANVSGKQLLEVAHQIKTIFPKENVSTYFVPYKRNKKSKIGRASGKLHSCLSNQKKKYRKAKKKAEKEIVDVGEGTSSSMFTTAETDELLENVLMQHNANESAETMEPNFQEQSILKILLATPEGRSLLKFNKNKSVLDNTERRKLCHLVVTDLLGDDPSNVRISSQNLLNLACQIKEIFPKENVSTYFIPYTNKRNPKGKLYDCLSNRKKQYNREFKKAENTIEYNKGVSTSNFPTKAKKVVISKEILWLNDFSGPWELVEKKWKKSLEYRLSQLKDSLGVAQYMIQYPALKMPTGYQLLIQDFESLYPGYKDKLCENFPLYKGKIIEIALGKLKRTQDSTIRSLLEDYEKQSQREGSNASQDLISESTSISAFLLLASLVGRITIKTKESCLRPSKQESRERFIKYVATEKDLNEAITAKTDKESQIGSSSQPSIFIVGPSITAIEQYFVVVDGTLYEVHSILQAVDVCFKMYTSLNCKYPIKCENVWNFIQKGFYNIINPWDKEFVAVNELLADLGIDS